MSETIKFEDLKKDIDLDAYEKMQKDIRENAVRIISKKFKQIFEDFNEVQAVVWVQYAPYFNDGEPCIFSVNELNFKLTKDNTEAEVDEDEDADEYEDDDYSDYAWESDVKDSKSPVGQAEKMLNDFAQSLENIFEEAFGSDSLVICTREGFEVREYEHD